MIRKLRGIIDEKGLGEIVLDVAGVGYLLHVSNNTLSSLRASSTNEISLWTYMAVRENSMDLYGFATADELEFFELLLGISGIGPKTALGILDSAPIETIKEGVLSGDPSYLTKVSGIGKKSAQKIVLELRDKLGAIGDAKTINGESGATAIEALVQLGYSERDAREAIQKVDKTQSTETMIKEALKQLSS